VNISTYASRFGSFATISCTTRFVSRILSTSAQRARLGLIDMMTIRVCGSFAWMASTNAL